MPIQHSEIHSEFCEQVKTSFRVLYLAKPDLLHIFKQMKFVENYALPQETTYMLVKYLQIFEKLKNDHLYGGKKPKDAITEEMSLSNLRRALKLSTLLKNQEVAAFRREQIQSDAFEFRVKSTLDKFEVLSYYNELAKCW